MEIALTDVSQVVGMALGAWILGWCLGFFHRATEKIGEQVV